MTDFRQPMRIKLIQLVRMNECLYNPKHSFYKNKVSKALIWEEIGENLNIEASRARVIWRTLRDGYIRHKNALKNGKTHGYSSWSEYLTFLDEVNEPKDATVDITQDSNSQQQVFFSEDLYAQLNEDSSGQQAEKCRVGSVASSPIPDHNAKPESTSTYQQSDRDSKKRKTDTMDKVIDYLKSKKNKEHDAVDLLFMSYAKTYKSLAPRKQAKLKVTLAKVFAEAEFGDLDIDDDK